MMILRCLRVCLWKHSVTRLRHWVSTLTDLLLPCLLFASLANLHSSFGDNFGPTEHKRWMPGRKPLTVVACDGRWVSGSVLYWPNTPTATLVMAMVAAWTRQICKDHSKLCTLF